MEKKYTNALYPDKANDLIDNEGNINPAVLADYASKEYVEEKIAEAVSGGNE